MDGGIARKPTVLRWSLILAVGLGILASVITLWRYQLDYDAQKRVQATEREARLAALRAEAEAQRIEREWQSAKAKSVARVEQLYREIDNLSQMGDRVQASLQRRPRMLKTSDPQSQTGP